MTYCTLWKLHTIILSIASLQGPLSLNEDPRANLICICLSHLILAVNDKNEVS
jgi:hypothetical protein